MTEFGKSSLLDLPTLAQLGYRMVLYPLTAFRVAMRAAQQALIHLMENGSQTELVGQMLTRAELYDLLGYQGYEQRDRAYFGQPK
jgi:methylisocitrate lyase